LIVRRFGLHASDGVNSTDIRIDATFWPSFRVAVALRQLLEILPIGHLHHGARRIAWRGIAKDPAQLGVPPA
jgi:hypothetical protein